MTEYVKVTDFASKDALSPGNAAKVIKGTEIDAEFELLETAVETKLDKTSGTLTSATLAGTIVNGAVTATCAPLVASTGETAAVGHRGKVISSTGAITVPNAIFAAGDAFGVYNNSASAFNITQGASVTLRWAGTTTTGTRSLLPRGQCVVWFNSSSEAVISGAGLA
jgi:hypothetical protein